jgi:hypothetical protein
MDKMRAFWCTYKLLWNLGPQKPTLERFPAPVSLKNLLQLSSQPFQCPLTCHLAIRLNTMFYAELPVRTANLHSCYAKLIEIHSRWKMRESTSPTVTHDSFWTASALPGYSDVHNKFRGKWCPQHTYRTQYQTWTSKHARTLVRKDLQYTSQYI